MAVDLSITMIVVTRALLTRGGFTRGGHCQVGSGRRLLTFSLKGFTTTLAKYYPVGKSMSEATVKRRCRKGARLAKVITKVSVVVLLLYKARFVKFLPIPILATVIVSTLLKTARFRLTIHL